MIRIAHRLAPGALQSACRLIRSILLATSVLHAALADATDPSSVGAVPLAPLAAGEAAPDFTLSDQNGRPHTLSAERGRRVMVLVFYRGHW